MVTASGLNKPALDIGWQAVAAIAYSTDIGMMFIGVGLLFQVAFWLCKLTDIFMPSDLWNNYSISVCILISEKFCIYSFVHTCFRVKEVRHKTIYTVDGILSTFY